MFSKQLQILSIFLLLLGAGCGEKKKVLLSGEAPVSITDFIAFFTPVSRPFTIADSILTKKFSDSLIISTPVLSAILPDSVLRSFTTKKERPQFHAIGKIEVPDAETYILIHLSSRSKRMLWILIFDNELAYQSSTSFFYPLPKKGIQQSVLSE
jgi:hypothetical protein